MFKSLNKREHGFQIESFAKQQLQKAGCQVVETNFQCKMGEIDLIVKDKSNLVFVEVRYRRSVNFGGAGASVDFKKQQKLIRAAAYYLQTKNLTNKARGRFDVFAVHGETDKLSFEWIKDAFDASI